MSWKNLFVVLVALALCATAKISIDPGPVDKIPNGFYETIIIDPGSFPLQNITITVSADPRLKVVPETIILPFNSTSIVKARVYAKQVTNGEYASINFTSTSTHPDFIFSETISYRVIQSCGVVYFNTENCPREEQWVYFGGQISRDSSSVPALLNVTVQDATAFDVFLSVDKNCPNSKLFKNRLPETDTDDGLNRMAFAFQYLVSPGGAVNLYSRLGFRLRKNTTCTEFAVAFFDANEDSRLVCDSPLNAYKCSVKLLSWHIAIIVVGSIIILLAIFAIAFCLYKKSK